VRAIGYWRANRRLCGVGFLPEALKPAHADRIYADGLVAWWPSVHTEVGGVQLFLMRYGDHDLAIDPRQLLDLGPLHERRAGLWVEGLRMAAVPWDADLPVPSSVPLGVTLEPAAGRVVSRFSRRATPPLEIVAVEPLEGFWSRHTPLLVGGAVLGVLLLAAWIDLVLRFSRRRLGLDAELAEAIAEGRIRVVYQPVIDLADGRCVGAEALARWTREDGSPVSPNVFVPAAEAAGLVQDLTLAVLRTLVRDLEYLLPHFPDFSINLNLSPQDLRDERVTAAIADTLGAAGVAAPAVKLEITERALVNSDVSRALIAGLRRRGHQVAIDDFGTGYSSLSYLQSFELDVLKIDKSFVDAIGTEAATSQVIVHVIEMARALGLATVAEGVESAAQQRWLCEHGVTYGQGYLFARPLALGDLFAYLRDRAG
jgi:sensor c-di-GMP phosphodiesterase-like protein